MRDLQRRLIAAGHDTTPDEPGVFGEGTERALRSFQDKRGLRSDGVCGNQTWAAVVEAGWSLGDRLLYHRAPPLRGDDVAALQRRLGALGFDAGRVDGIFGERTAGALEEFQRNGGLTTDGICGPATLGALERLGGRSGEGVAAVREREALRRSPRTLAGRRIVVGEPGGLDALAGAVGRALTDEGAVVVVLSDPDGSAQARQANAFDADLYLGLAGGPAGCTAAYYATQGFESTGGHHLARLVARELPSVLGPDASTTTKGMTLPVLRETRMPAVSCEVGPAPVLVELGAELAQALRRAVTAWARAPVEVDVEPSTD